MLDPSHIRFSVVIPTYNQAQLVSEAIKSVLAQEHPAQEVIVVDDGSKDNTPEVLRGFGKHLCVVRQENRGRNVARNTGISQATGDYIALLDHDDLFYEDTLAFYARVLAEHSYPPMLHGSAQGFVSIPTNRRLATDSNAFIKVYKDFLSTYDYFSWIGCSAFVLRADVLRSVNGFFSHRFLLEDVDLCLRLGDVGPFVKVFRPRTYLYRNLHPSSGTHSRSGNIQGIKYLLAQESRGRYVGGTRRKRDRMRIILQYVRSAGRSFAKAGLPLEALRIVVPTLHWQLRLGRFRFVCGFPCEVALGLIFRLKRTITHWITRLPERTQIT